MTDDLTIPAKRDDFSTESPVRAFTDFQVAGNYAIGKGFRPALQHLARYLDAMERVEKWALVQIIEAANPTIIFVKLTINAAFHSGGVIRSTEAPVVLKPGSDFAPPRKTKWTDRGSDLDIPVEFHEEAVRFIAEKRGIGRIADNLVRDFMLYFKPRNQPNQVTHKTFAAQIGFVLSSVKPEVLKQYIDDFRAEKGRVGELMDGMMGKVDPPALMPDDPVNPKHYNGRECADVGERMSANSYQVLKYCWRLGKKDDPCVELGKAIWYLDSEIDLDSLWDREDDLDPLPNIPNANLPKREWLDAKCAALDEWAKAVAVMLWEWNRTGETSHLRKLRTHLTTYKVHLDCGNGLAI